MLPQIDYFKKNLHEWKDMNNLTSNDLEEGDGKALFRAVYVAMMLRDERALSARMFNAPARNDPAFDRIVSFHKNMIEAMERSSRVTEELRKSLQPDVSLVGLVLALVVIAAIAVGRLNKARQPVVHQENRHQMRVARMARFDR